MIPARKFKEIWIECQICQKPLGHESREEGFALCHEHRKCSFCGEPLQVYEVNLCYDRAELKFQRDQKVNGDKAEFSWKEVNIIHSKCAQIGGPVPVSQAEFDFLNDARLALIPDMETTVQTNIQGAQLASKRLLSNMSFEEKCTALRMWEACLEMSRSTVASDPEYRKGVLEEKEREQFERVSKVREPKPQRPLKERYQKVEPTIVDKLSLESFISSHSLIENLGQKELHSMWRKGVLSFTKLGTPEDEAIKIADELLRKQGKIQ